MEDATWNVLHDGRLVAVEGTIPDDLRLTVEIAYLCRHLPTMHDHLIVTLIGCKRFEYKPYDQPLVAEPAAIAALGLEILEAGPGRDGPSLQINCADGGYGGELTSKYSFANVSTIEGRSLSQSELESASESYWSLWRQQHADGGDQPDRQSE